MVDIAEEFASRVNSFRAQDDERFEWMKRVQNEVEELSRKYKDACNDLERERIAGRETQKQAANWERQFHHVQQSVDDGSFVLLLIDADADGYTFKDEYYVPDGGQKAAFDLRAHVKVFLESKRPDLARLPVAVKAFANGDGTPKFLSKAGVLQSSYPLWRFAKCFSHSHAMSDFVFVGNGKDRADKKIKGVFEQFIKNPTCRHIILGACHDNGYVRMLEDFAEDSDIVQKVTLLYSFSVGNEFKNLPFQSMTMENIFRSSSPGTPTTTTTSKSRSGSTTEKTIASMPKSRATLASGRTTSSNGSHPTNSASSFVPRLLINAAGQRVDEKLPKPSQAAISSWNHKIKVEKIRYCRMYLLNHSCHGGCGFSHDSLSDELKLLFRSDFRQERCVKKLACRDVNCPYRHNCSCNKPRCNFPKSMHNIDEKTAKPPLGCT